MDHGDGRLAAVSCNRRGLADGVVCPPRHGVRRIRDGSRAACSALSWAAVAIVLVALRVWDGKPMVTLCSIRSKAVIRPCGYGWWPAGAADDQMRSTMNQLLSASGIGESNEAW